MNLVRGLLALCLMASASAWGQSPLDPLLDSGKLTIDSSLLPESGLVPGQRARLQIEIATSNWFTGGARIRLPEVPGLVILQTEEFANNASERRQGETWVVQRWTIDIFPQSAGEFSVGPIEVTLKVNGGELGNITGPVLAPAVDFSVVLPAALEDVPFWVAAPTFSVEQSLDRETDALAPGDAFERRLEFRASDIQAMMLPDFPVTDIPGLATYPDAPVLENRMNRGQASANRTQTISYVAERPGNYVLPAQDFFWWDTRAQSLGIISVPAVEVVVMGEPAADRAPSSTALRSRALGLAGIAALAVLALVLLRYRPWRALAGPVDRLARGYAALRKPGLDRYLNPRTSRDNNAGG